MPWKITTNLGNSTSFEYQSVESSALPLSNSMQIHRAPEGQVITGFLAKVKVSIASCKAARAAADSRCQHSCGSVQSLGFQSQVPDTPPCKSVTPLRRQPHSRQWQHMFPVLGGRFELAGHMLRYPGSCVTTVRLGGIKRIRISSGAAGRSRASEEISGLCFEFWDSDRPVIVGQWIEEITTVELKRGDRITGMSIWLSQTHDLRRAASMPTENNGRVVGINISTAAGIGKEARFGTNDAALLRLDFNENPFQRLVSPRLLPTAIQTPVVTNAYPFTVRHCLELQLQVGLPANPQRSRPVPPRHIAHPSPCASKPAVQRESPEVLLGRW